jgi:hypothetical protein
VSLRGASPSASNPDRTPQGFFLTDYLSRFEVVAVMSGGYIDNYSPPTALGLVKSNGTLVTPAHNSWLTDGLFCSNVGSAVIKPAEPDAFMTGFRDCLQAGPLLLADGKQESQTGAGYQKLAQSVQEQGFICIDGNGRILMGVTDKIKLAKLVDFLTMPEIGCKDALRLTGQDTAGLRDRNRNNPYGHDDYLFPDAIGIEARK